MRFGLSSEERSVQIEQVDGKAAVAAARKDPRVAKPNGQRRSAASRHIFGAPSSRSNRTQANAIRNRPVEAACRVAV